MAKRADGSGYAGLRRAANARDAIDEVLDQSEALPRQQGANVLDHHAVVDGVADLAGLEHGIAGNADLKVKLDRLRRYLLVAVQPDPGLEPEFANKDEVRRAAAVEGRILCQLA